MYIYFIIFYTKSSVHLFEGDDDDVIQYINKNGVFFYSLEIKIW